MIKASAVLKTDSKNFHFITSLFVRSVRDKIRSNCKITHTSNTTTINIKAFPMCKLCHLILLSLKNLIRNSV